jgi:hypothetical protein
MADMISFLTDILLALAAFGAAFYCMRLSKRLQKLTSFDDGLGGAIAVLSAQVDDMNKVLEQVKAGSGDAAARLETLTTEARTLAEELEIVMAACHDLTGPLETGPSPAPTAPILDAIMNETSSVAAPDAPVFGSRRSQPDEVDLTAPTPLFQHRQASVQRG